MAEEFGLLIALVPVVIFFIFGIGALRRIREIRNPFNAYAATGIVGYLMFQVCVNLSSNLGLMPTKGMTLPFISYGGSSFVSSCIAAGLLFALFQEYNMRADVPDAPDKQKKKGAQYVENT
jgi:cell division protein FtsW